MNPATPRAVIRVMDYDPEWPDQFCRLRDKIWPAVCDIALRVEHVGSTSVPGLAAKPVIDLDIVIPSRRDLGLMVTRLGGFGYEHCGNLGIADREAFRALENHPAHHLYVCPQDSIALCNHVAFRDHLRSHPADAAAYVSLKKGLAERFAYDIDSYAAGKTEFILSILARYGLSGDSLDSIRSANQR